ncbi:DNA replication complex subunit Gins51 [Halobiforma nitratireducens]|uniref:Gins51 C-terminal domain-containing protein n=1 Tax=Halobiforma nitratireducens JCM 10879 TaxID=1227454 RepID=M0M8N3_9EURY|nr:hypothetical protein [Halobiforma nitratireducens]EMA41713.1 hypothetical protein C446_05340 [Halobiforma nitratireducens JCM 10879]
MNLDELRSVQSKERQKDSLQNLRPSFYQEVGEYISELEDERDRAAERADDPFSSPEVSRLTDEIETAKDVVEAIYERRMGKLVKQASLAAAGMAADDEGLTAEEADLFADLVDRIESNKGRVLDVLEGEGEEPPETNAGPETGTGTDAPSSVAAPGTPDREPDADPELATDSGREPTPSSEVPPDSAPEPGLESGPGTEAGPNPDQDSSTRDADDAPPAPPHEPPSDTSASPDGDSSDVSSGVPAADVMGDGPPIGDGQEHGSEFGPDADSEPASRANGGDEDPSAVPSATAAERSDRASGDATDAASTTDRTHTTPDSGSDDTDDLERVTVRITRDVGSILGVDDREYTLSSDDVVTLPEQNATPLVDREAAEPLE